MKKFFSFLVLIIMCCATVFSGCSLITTNHAKYYDQVVAKCGSDVTIYMEDLLVGYNSFGYKYVSEEKYTTEKAVKKTIDDLINRELIYNYATKKLGSLKTYETNSIMQEVYDYINSQLLTIENTIRTELNKPANEDTVEEKKPAFSPYNEYEKKIIYNKETQKFERVVETEPADESPIGAFVQTINGDEEISAKAWTRYIRQLKSNEKGRNKSTVESEIFQREIERLYEIYEKNYVLEKFQTKFNNSIELDTLLTQVVDKYVELAKASAYDYNDDITSYVKKMQSDAKSIYYHGNGEQTTLVAHVLIKYSDEQSALIKDYKEQLASGQINQQQYDNRMATLASEISGYARDEDGFEIGKPVSANDILTEIQTTLSSKSTLEEKAIAFNNFVYKYGQDPGMINAESYYAINLQVNDEITDNMVKSFADECRRLYNEEGDGSLSDLILTNNGYHIIFNVGAPDLVAFENLDKTTARALCDTKRMIGTNKSLFDEMLEKVTEYSFDTYYTSLIKELRSNNTIYKYAKVFKQLY